MRIGKHAEARGRAQVRRLRDAMDSLGVTGEEAAELMELPKSTVSHWLSGRSVPVYSKNLKAIASFCESVEQSTTTLGNGKPVSRTQPTESTHSLKLSDIVKSLSREELERLAISAIQEAARKE